MAMIANDGIEVGNLMKQKDNYYKRLIEIHKLDKLIFSRQHINMILENILRIAEQLTNANIVSSHLSLIERYKNGDFLIQYPRKRLERINILLGKNDYKNKDYKIFRKFDIDIPPSKIEKKGITRQAILINKPLIVRHTDELWKKYFIRDAKGIKSKIVIPLTINRKPIGCINIGSSDPDAFDEIYVELLETLAGQAVIVIQLNKMFSLIRKIGRASITQTKTQLLKLILNTGCELIGTDTGSIYEYSSEIDILTVGLNSGYEQYLLNNDNWKYSFIKRSLLAKRIIRIQVQKYINSRRKYTRDYYNLLYENNIKTLIAVPLVINEKSIGIMNLYLQDNLPNRYWTESWEKSFLELFATQTAIALQSHNRYYELKQSVPIINLENISQIILFISHRMNNSVGNIRADVLDLIDKEYNTKEEIFEKYNNIYQEAEKTLKLPYQLIQFSKNIYINKIPINLFNVIEEIKKEMRIKKVRLKIEEIRNLPMIYATKEILKEIFKELFNNSIKAMPAGGIIDIKGRVLNQNMLEIRVRDTGHGVKNEDILKMFEFGFTEWPAKSTKGSGDGLAIIKGYVELALRGKISVKSKLGKGCTFILEFPIYIM